MKATAQCQQCLTTVEYEVPFTVPTCPCGGETWKIVDPIEKLAAATVDPSAFWSKRALKSQTEARIMRRVTRELTGMDPDALANLDDAIDADIAAQLSTPGKK